ncbi:MAG TPA: hypothetical protein VFS20_33890 [Longimicrobium sp.]|nr:hypothetical protein [Longimicrobium sp.]
MLAVLGACTPVEEPVNAPLHVGSHVIPAEEVRAYLAEHVGFTSRGGTVFCSYAVVGQEGHRVFVDAVCEELVAGLDSLESGSGTGVPVALEVDTVPAPRIRAHRRPGDGNRYARDLRAIFPQSVLRRIDLPAAERNARGMRLRAENRRLAGQLGIGPDSVAAPSADHAAEYEAAARELVAFLRGQGGFERVSVADSVMLHVSPEGGGTRAVLTREQLRDPVSWRVASGRQTYSFVPPARATRLTVRAGSHFNCREYPLSSRFPGVARLPHVGVKLEPEGAESCLQTWNVTFVFDPAARPARLVAAVYDQWEW